MEIQCNCYIVNSYTLIAEHNYIQHSVHSYAFRDARVLLIILCDQSIYECLVLRCLLFAIL